MSRANVLNRKRLAAGAFTVTSRGTFLDDSRVMSHTQNGIIIMPEKDIPLKHLFLSLKLQISSGWLRIIPPVQTRRMRGLFGG